MFNPKILLAVISLWMKKYSALLKFYYFLTFSLNFVLFEQCCRVQFPNLLIAPSDKNFKKIKINIL